MLKLSKIQALLLGLGLILLIYFGERASHIIGADIIRGEFVFYIDEVVDAEKVSFPIIEYAAKDSVYQFRAKRDTHYEVGQTVSVLLENKNPDTPLLFTAGSFWLYPLLFYVLPLLIWISFITSYIAKNEIVEIRIRTPYFRKTKKSVDLS